MLKLNSLFAHTSAKGGNSFFLVRADTEEVARITADKKSGDSRENWVNGTRVWLDENYSEVCEIDANGPTAAILQG
jgi:hypothetical protein